MNAGFRVRARPAAGGEDAVMELFEARSDAEKMYAGLQKDAEDNLANVIPGGALCISLEEMCNGTWTYVSRRVVVR